MSPSERLSAHVPTAKELAVLEEFLAISRSTLPLREGYEFQQALAKVEAFRAKHSDQLSSWLSAIVAEERERLVKGMETWQRPLFPAGLSATLLLRSGRSVQGRVIEESLSSIVLELPTGFRETFALPGIAPASFPKARVDTQESLLALSAAGDARGALRKTDLLGKLDRARLLPLLLDQAIEEALLGVDRREDVEALVSFRIPEDHRTMAEALIPHRLRHLETEQRAAALYKPARQGDEVAFASLVGELSGTRAGRQLTRRALLEFEARLIQGDAGESAGAGHWVNYHKDAADAGEGGGLRRDGEEYVLSAPTPGAWAWVWRDHWGSKKGYRVLWAFDPDSPPDGRFMVALELRTRLEIGIRDVLLKQLVEKDGRQQEVLRRKIDLSQSVAEGTIAVVPTNGHILLYLNREFLMALPSPEYRMGGRFQLGVVGANARVRSIRVVDSNRYE